MTSALGRGRGSRSSTARKCENICMTAFRVAVVFSLSAFRPNAAFGNVSQAQTEGSGPVINLIWLMRVVLLVQSDRRAVFS